MAGEPLPGVPDRIAAADAGIDAIPTPVPERALAAAEAADAAHGRRRPAC
jgi:hypothetical protein